MFQLFRSRKCIRKYICKRRDGITRVKIKYIIWDATDRYPTSRRRDPLISGQRERFTMQMLKHADSAICKPEHDSVSGRGHCKNTVRGRRINIARNLPPFQFSPSINRAAGLAPGPGI